MPSAGTWPGGLPQSVLAGAVVAPNEEVIRFATDGGVAKVRRVFNSSVERVTTRMVLTEAQLATFDAFYYTTLVSGSLSFDWVDPRDGTTTREFRFISYPQWTGTPSNSGRIWEGQLQLEMLP